MEKTFEVICRHKDTNSSNLNKVFSSYGCDTLEAKVPIVDVPVADKLQEIKGERRIYATLTLKAESASRALQGRPCRTRDRSLKLVEINGETLIAAGEVRDRSPVDEDKLDDELEQYMQERAKLKANNPASTNVKPQPRVTSRKEQIGDEDLDEDLDAYMREAARLKAQKRQLVEQTDRMAAMMDMEEFNDVDNDMLDENGF